MTISCRSIAPPSVGKDEKTLLMFSIICWLYAMLAVFVEMELSAVSSLPVAAVREPSAAVSLVYKPNVSGLLSSVVILLSFVITCVSTLKCYYST